MGLLVDSCELSDEFSCSLVTGEMVEKKATRGFHNGNLQSFLEVLNFFSNWVQYDSFFNCSQVYTLDLFNEISDCFRISYTYTQCTKVFDYFVLAL